MSARGRLDYVKVERPNLKVTETIPWVCALECTQKGKAESLSWLIMERHLGPTKLYNFIYPLGPYRPKGKNSTPKKQSPHLQMQTYRHKCINVTSQYIKSKFRL